MPKILTNKWFIIGVVAVVVGLFGYKYWQSKQGALPAGIASGNGRVEAKLVDVSAKEPLRVKDILVNEGDLVQRGQVLVHLDTTTVEAELAGDKSTALAAKEQLAAAKSAIVKKTSEVKLARIEVDRSRKMLAERASSQREFDVRTTALASAEASLEQDQAKLQSAQLDIETAEAKVAKTQSRITDATLTSPVLGRVLYRLAEPGEVLGPGGKALTLVNLETSTWRSFCHPPRRQRSRSARTLASRSIMHPVSLSPAASALYRRKRSSRPSRWRPRASARN